MVERSSVRAESRDFRASFIAARSRSSSPAMSDGPNAPVLAARGVHLALLPLTGLLVVAVLAEIRENPGLLALFLEALERPFETLVIVDDDFRHLKTHLFSGARPVGAAKCGRRKKLMGIGDSGKGIGNVPRQSRIPYPESPSHPGGQCISRPPRIWRWR